MVHSLSLSFGIPQGLESSSGGTGLRRVITVLTLVCFLLHIVSQSVTSPELFQFSPTLVPALQLTFPSFLPSGLEPLRTNTALFLKLFSWIRSLGYNHGDHPQWLRRACPGSHLWATQKLFSTSLPPPQTRKRESREPLGLPQRASLLGGAMLWPGT